VQKQHKTNSRLSINGFTMNPITDSRALMDVVYGLTKYKNKHVCDFGGLSIHNNYLGKIIGQPKVIRISQEENEGLQAHVDLTNGWFTIKIWDKTYPAEVMADFYIRGPLDDPDLIIDHLCAPAIPHDGMGLFDYQYSISSSSALNHIMQKNEKNESPYIVNDPIRRFDDNTKWDVVLNQLSNIQCYYCSDKATEWIIIGPPWHPLLTENEKYLTASKVVPSCYGHQHSGRKNENAYNSNQIPEKDFKFGQENMSEFVRVEVKDELGNLLHTVNEVVDPNL
jgi:hypothetical protein